MGAPNKLTIIAAAVHSLHDQKTVFSAASSEAKKKAIAVAEFLSGYAYGAQTLDMKRFEEATTKALDAQYQSDPRVENKETVPSHIVISLYLNIESALK